LLPWSEFATKVIVAAVVLKYTSFGKVRMYVGRELYIYVIKYAARTINGV
jgi:hypothetical protein